MSTIDNLVTRALDTDFDTTTRSADALRFIQHAIGFIYRQTSLTRGDFSETINTVANQPSNTFTGTDRGLVIRTILNDLGNPLDELDRDSVIASQAASPNRRQRPYAYALAGANVTTEAPSILWLPTPDRAYAFTAIGRFETPAAAVALGQNVPLPDDYEDLPVYFARAELFDLQDDDAGAARWRAKWTAGLGQIARDLNRRSGGGNRRVPGTWSGSSSPGRFYRPDGSRVG